MAAEAAVGEIHVIYLVNIKFITTKQSIFRVIRFVYNKRQALQGSPHRHRICEKVFKLKTKKPCSSNRSTALVFLTSKKRVFCHIPGEKHNLRKRSKVLIHRHRVLDLPSVHYPALRFF